MGKCKNHVLQTMASLKTSLIITIRNEEKTILNLLKSIQEQSCLPDEVIIADGGSTDATTTEILHFVQNDKSKKLNLKLIVKKGNRSAGRNEAIKNASGDLILITDAGCTLAKNWVKNISKPFSNSSIDVVAGYYKGIADSIFQKCLIPYVLVMPDKINPKNFLPATRSMAFRKSVWDQTGGFEEKFSHNEDYVFAIQIKNKGYNIVFQESAIVYWQPQKKISEAFIMFFRFAYGDAESGILRPKVILIFLRYLLLFGLLLGSRLHHNKLFLTAFYLLLIAYLIWSVKKNYKYIKRFQAIYLLPLTQIISDFSIIAGTILGFTKKLILDVS